MGDAKAEIVNLATREEGVAASEVAARLGVSRQAAHGHLRTLVDAGVLLRQGAGRATRYHLRVREHRFTYDRSGLEEERVWLELCRRVPEIGSLAGEAKHVFNYAVTELVNNAIDHSASLTVEVEIRVAPGRLSVAVIDCGVGIYDHLREVLKLDDDLAALQELSKGKTTTDPARHTGEGIFFTSKVADRFEIESGRLRWVVDNLREDMAVGSVEPPRTGTRVVFEASPRQPRSLRQLFDAYTDNLSFTRTRAVVKLFAIGVEFVSRSEAKRLVRDLERFREVVLDFAGVEMVGQGFADEVFRVWANAHPEVGLQAVNMSEPVAFMVARAKQTGAN